MGQMCMSVRLIMRSMCVFEHPILGVATKVHARSTIYAKKNKYIP